MSDTRRVVLSSSFTPSRCSSRATLLLTAEDVVRSCRAALVKFRVSATRTNVAMVVRVSMGTDL
nr:hypothetical protein [Pyxidicoccus parkwaysis]